MAADFSLFMDGSVALLTPNTAAAREHLSSHTDESNQWFGRALVIEPRYLDTIIGLLSEEGFSIG